jgi:hypothetical protein
MEELNQHWNWYIAGGWIGDTIRALNQDPEFEIPVWCLYIVVVIKSGL